MACTPSPAWGVKILEKSLQRGGGSENFILAGEGVILLRGGGGGGGGNFVGGLRNLEVKLKSHNVSIKSIFGLTNLYFRDI